MKTTKYLGHIFESSCYKTPEFIQFSRDFRSDLRAMLVKTDWMIDTLSVGHFYISGFLKHMKTGEFVYISISDVRFFRDEWYNQMLVRTAKSNTDYTGGANGHTNFTGIAAYLSLKTLDIFKRS
jgi:hypothetical protein